MELIRANAKMHFTNIKKLYQEAFPRYEKKPFWLIKYKQKQGLVDIWVLEKEGEFIGLAITMKSNDLVLLDYFAIAGEKRASGFGSEALRSLQEHYRGKRFFLEIESTKGKAHNQEQRERRKGFYLANHMTEIGMTVDVFGTEMELLGYDCNLDFAEYVSVYSDVYGKRKADKLKER